MATMGCRLRACFLATALIGSAMCFLQHAPRNGPLNRATAARIARDSRIGQANSAETGLGSSSGSCGDAITREIDMHPTAILKIPPKLTSSPCGVGNMRPQGQYLDYVHDSECLVWAKHTEEAPVQAQAFARAGPVESLHFDPSAPTNYAIVTCGGLCPGLNGIIHHVTETLVNGYCVSGTIWGIRGGYHGFHGHEKLLPMNLSSMWARGDLSGLQHEPGSILGSSRGGFDIDKILAFLEERSISQLYVVGGDGTLAGASIIAQECIKRDLNISVAGIPKTVDNDVALVDRSFGFMTAVESAQLAIQAAVTEARCNLPNGIGVVKLMGRSSGFIAAYSTLAAGGDVDLCLIPEVEIVLRGPGGCLPHLASRVREKGYCVVVVAEGAGEELLGESSERDAGGNRKLPAIGVFMKDQIQAYFKEMDMPCTLKLIDPSYIIRAGRANAFDQILTLQLSQNAVHGAFAGYTCFTTGLINNHSVWIPMKDIVEQSPRFMDTSTSRTWERVLSITRQPNTRSKIPGEKE
jgi:6-phosphofructokinase 1